MKLFDTKNFIAQELAVRSIALSSFIIAAFLIIRAVQPQRPFLYVAVPFTLLTNIGRYAVPFIWSDFLFMAVGLYSIVRSHEKKIFRYGFRASLVILPLFLQTTLAYLFFFILVDYLISRNTRDTLYNFLWFIVGSLAVFIVLLSAYPGDLARGWDGLSEAIVTRSPLASPRVIPNPELAFGNFLRLLGRRAYQAFNLGLFGPLVMVASWLTAIKKREWWLAALLPAALFYLIIFRGATFDYYNNYLPYAFFAVVTFFFGVNLVLDHLAPSLKRIRGWYSREGIADRFFRRAPEMILATLLLINTYLYPTVYFIDDRVKNIFGVSSSYPFNPMTEAVYLLTLLTQGRVKEDIERMGCNSFVWRQPPEPESPPISDYVPAVLGRYVVARIKNHEEVRKCLLDAKDLTISVSLLEGGSE